MSSRAFWSRDQWAAANPQYTRVVGLASRVQECRIEGCTNLVMDGDLYARCQEEIEALEKWRVNQERKVAERAFVAHRKDLASAERELREDRIRRAGLDEPKRETDALTWLLVVFVLGGLSIIGWDYGKAFIEWILAGGVR